MEQRFNSPATGSPSVAADRSTTAGIAGRVREQAAVQLSKQKDRATDGLGSVAQAVRDTTQHLRNHQHETVAEYAEKAARQIERLSEGLRNKDVGELLNDAQDLARRRPALFVGGAFAAGLLGARFLKSSAPEDPWRRDLPQTYEGNSAAYRSRDIRAGGTASSTNAYGHTVPRTETSAGTPPAPGRREYPGTENY